jgi:predicted nucleic acid-binding protein
MDKLKYLLDTNICIHFLKNDIKVVKKIKELGTPISDFDLLIGCTALVNDFTLASRNIKEMGRIEGLKLENWID